MAVLVLNIEVNRAKATFGKWNAKIRQGYKGRNFAKRLRCVALKIPQMKIIRCWLSHSTFFELVVEENNFICSAEF